MPTLQEASKQAKKKSTCKTGHLTRSNKSQLSNNTWVQQQQLVVSPVHPDEMSGNGEKLARGASISDKEVHGEPKEWDTRPFLVLYNPLDLALGSRCLKAWPVVFVPSADRTTMNSNQVHEAVHRLHCSLARAPNRKVELFVAVFLVLWFDPRHLVVVMVATNLLELLFAPGKRHLHHRDCRRLLMVHFYSSSTMMMMMMRRRRTMRMMTSPLMLSSSTCCYHRLKKRAARRRLFDDDPEAIVFYRLTRFPHGTIPWTEKKSSLFSCRDQDYAVCTLLPYCFIFLSPLSLFFLLFF